MTRIRTWSKHHCSIPSHIPSHTTLWLQGGHANYLNKSHCNKWYMTANGNLTVRNGIWKLTVIGCNKWCYHRPIGLIQYLQVKVTFIKYTKQKNLVLHFRVIHLPMVLTKYLSSLTEGIHQLFYSYTHYPLSSKVVMGILWYIAMAGDVTMQEKTHPYCWMCVGEMTWLAEINYLI